MAPAGKRSTKKLSRATIQAISRAGKGQSETDVYGKVCREARETFAVYFESCSGEIDALETNGLFPGLLKRSSDYFFNLFSDKIKGKHDKYALLQGRWYEFVRKLLASTDVCHIVREMPSNAKAVVSCYLESVLSAGFKFVRERQEGSSGTRNATTGSVNISEHDVLLLKLGSAAALKLKKRLWKIAQPLSKSKQSLKKLFLMEIEAIEKMENLEKKNIPSFIRYLDEGNLLVLKSELLPFLRAFTKVFRCVVNENGYNLLGKRLFKVSSRKIRNDFRPKLLH